ncbi:Glutathione S-transferase kappa 1 [Aphelenchoides fujianensis]|nr:Glutathione S-transferase kappa 1 [Aphelenchoides fujianensis]
MAAKRSLSCFFDCVSPYSYIGFESLLQYERRLGLQVDFRPVFNGILMKNAGNEAPANVEKKGAQMFRDLPLVADSWGIPYKNVTNFHGRVMSKRSTPALRFLTACRREQPADFRRAIRTLFTSLYVNDEDIFEEADVRKIFDRAEFPHRERLFELMNTKEVKQELTATTNEAADLGAFGVPWLVLKREGREDVVLFGSDRLPVLCHLLDAKFEGRLGLAAV